MIDLVIATRNRHKVREIGALLEGLPLRVRSSLDFPELGEIEETGSTFEENALIKARETALAVGCMALADDSGLEVEALAGRPGVMSARYAGAQATDHDNVRRLLDEMEEIPAERRAARFCCCIAVVDARGLPVGVVEGVVCGRISAAPAGPAGFGYDPVFIPDGHTRTFAQMSAGEKNAISHRAVALEKIRVLLREFLAK